MYNYTFVVWGQGHRRGRPSVKTLMCTRVLLRGLYDTPICSVIKMICFRKEHAGVDLQPPLRRPHAGVCLRVGVVLLHTVY